MGSEQAIKAVASQPISAISTLKFNTETRLQNVLERTEETQRRIFESIEAYNERMKAFYAERAKRLAEERQHNVEKRSEEIASLGLLNTQDPATMREGLSQITSLLNYATYHKLPASVENVVYNAKTLGREVENKLYNYKKGENYSSTGTSNPMLYNGDFQNLGERDFLS